jgi:hypothetical protein
MSYSIILYNQFDISDEILDLYEEKYGEQYDFSCDNSKMIYLIESLNISVCKAYFDKKYEGCWRIHEYDGMESVKIDIEKYRIKMIKEIPEEEFTREKVMEILDMKI